MTSAQEARADGWQRDTASLLRTVAALARENRQLREQLAAKGRAMTAEPVPDTDAFDGARDRITWQNQAVREAVAAERERIRQLAIDHVANAKVEDPSRPYGYRYVRFADLIEETAP